MERLARSVRATLGAHEGAVVRAVRAQGGACAGARARTAWAGVVAHLPEALGRYLETEAALFSYSGSVEEAGATSAYEAGARALCGARQWAGPVPETLESRACAAWRAAAQVGADPDGGDAEHEVGAALYACTGALKSAVRMRTAGWRHQEVGPALLWARERLRNAGKEAARTARAWEPRAVLVGGLARLEALAHSRALARLRYRDPDPVPDWLAEAVLGEGGGGTVPAATLERPLEQWTAEVVRARARAAGLAGGRGSARAIDQAARDWGRSRAGRVTPPMMGLMAAGVARARLDTGALRSAALDVEGRGPQGGALEHWQAIERASATVGEEIAQALRASALASVGAWAGGAHAERALEALERRWRAEGAGDPSGTMVIDTCEGRPGWRASGGGVHLEMVRAQGDVRALEHTGVETVEVFVAAGTKQVRAVARTRAPGGLGGRRTQRWKAQAVRAVAEALGAGGERG